ncbi:hypothetical protein AGABI1DRAFT_112884 [Agaricus bisporus var. burnettii JB137-S8]|uniref:NADP-dependent oxidoreductase domain-containing protein n=2 Tax=Agaricus bisporus var. burnettii TaxID=192524 RepID=K5XDG6_AGABU|nr:hypothetical protein AGABI2DRAFT_192853 [Agaricus bisporus var. bisporus H97]XP_007328666.1 uncharacterized protein AGABI1DRAFT_112884 [Agaricus bisporus var. burnettii JB137-S8]EKM81197.1 hypothetical protein AGABI1DRAFT_112884 [Agaricus bisporus var. burnettii JB137-S8]EKV47678.1 hypothetical protein AGABI2DRAFT_192853 [Agaricus bisporus var. bisporus H97]KAF7782761.1 hypothetical protein Agabi119p4_2137 [Agaricus bisporus var. burnettii]
MSFGKTITLSNGAKMPRIGLGTWQSKPHEVENAVEIAVRNGYRHLDLAMIYQNQDEVGRALKKVIPSVVKREELFITSKLWNNAHQPDQVENQLDETLKQLGLDYLDLYLIHWPVAFPPGNGFFPPHSSLKDEVELDTETSLVDTWKAMLALPKSKVRAVGVSNFTVEHLKGIFDATGVHPVANQIEAHPLLQQPELVKYCQEHNIHITAYSPLGNNSEGKPMHTENPVVVEIAKRLNATPAQVLIAWGARRGQSVIPKSVHEDRIISNFKEVEITDDDFARMNKIGEGDLWHRYNIPFFYNPCWSISTFSEDREKGARVPVKIN